MKSFSEFSKEYDQRPEFSSQRTLSSLDFYKHDFLYSKTICEKLLSEQLVYTPKTQYSIGDFHQDKLQSLLERLNQQDQTLLVSDFNDCFKVHDIQHRWTRMYKAQLFEKNDPNIDNGNNELLVLVYLDKKIQKGNFKSIVEDLDYQPSDRIKHKGEIDIKAMRDWVGDDRDWDWSCRENAMLIWEKFGRRLPHFEFHHRSVLSEAIRERGRRLSHMHDDKWNTSDIYFIKPNIKPLNKFTTIESYNEYIGSDEDVIGVSLKKDEKSQMGSYSLARMCKEFALEYLDHKMFKLVNKGSYNTEYNKKIKQFVISIRDKCQDKLKVVEFVPDIDDKHIDQTISNIRANTQYYYRSILPSLNWLDQMKSFDQLQKYTGILVTTAIGRNPNACPHWQINAKRLEHVRPIDENTKWELNSVTIPLSGSPEVRIEGLLDGNVIDGRLRVRNGSGPNMTTRLRKYQSN